MDCFDTKIEFYYREHTPLRPTSTLAQHNVRANDTLSARITQTKKPPILEEVIAKDVKNRPKTKDTNCYGLTFVCTCVEPKCVNYGRDVSIPFGMGEFSFFPIINKIKCQVCPYRDQMKNPPMIVKGVELSHCVWKVEGTHMFRNFPTHHISEWRKCKERHNFYDELRRYKWQQDMVLTVKDL